VELAWSLAEELGHSVLLVDGTFEVGALSNTLGLAERPGVAELLDANAPSHAILQSLVQPTMHARISVLPRGNDSDNHSTRSDAVRQLVALASEHFEFVLVQGSIQAEGSRSLLFSSATNAALLVAVEDRTLVDQITRGQRLLSDCGAGRVALVLTHRPEAPPPKAP
jgi:receptor protein-tyrosine kinase